MLQSDLVTIYFNKIDNSFVEKLRKYQKKYVKTEKYIFLCV